MQAFLAKKRYFAVVTTDELCAKEINREVIVVMKLSPDIGEESKM